MADIVISDKDIESIINEVEFPASTAAFSPIDICAAIDVVIQFLGTLKPTHPLLKIAIFVIIALLNAYKAKNCTNP